MKRDMNRLLGLTWWIENLTLYEKEELMKVDKPFRWQKKSLGEEGTIPRVCPICGTDLTEKGWSVGVYQVYGIECQHHFPLAEIEHDSNNGHR